MEKKLLYIYLGGAISSNSSGVQKKVFSKIKNINGLGCFCKGVSFSNEIKEEKQVNEFFTVIPFQKNKRKFFNSLFQQKLLINSVELYLKENIGEFTHVLFRYPLASRSLLRLVKRFPDKIIFEHNTKEIEELKLNAKAFRKALSFSLKPGYFIFLLELGYLSFLQEIVLGKKIFKYAKSGVAVTQEIAKYEMQRNSEYNVSVCSNGIDVAQTTLITPIIFDGTELKLFMLLGSSNDWSGVDRLVKSVAEYKGDCTIKVDLIGALEDKDIALISQLRLGEMISVLPPLTTDALNEKLDCYHLGVGSLCAFRKGLNEASSLKTREYLSRGCGVIVGYEDTDFNASKDFEGFYMKVPANESLIDFNAVIDFTHKLFEDKEYPIKIRELALKRIDTKVKMKELIDYLDN